MKDFLYYQRALAFWRQFSTNHLGVFGLVILMFYIVIALLANTLALYPPLMTGTGASFAGVSTAHPLGTDNLGRDIFSETLHGARATLIVSFLAVLATTVIGLGFGALAGYFGGWIDDALMRITEVFLAIPAIFLALVFVSIFGGNVWNIVVVIALLSWPQMARLVRAEFLVIKELTYIDAARTSGASNLYVIFREILPNAMSTVIVNISLTQANAILIESSLSFLGFGDPAVVSWGLMLHNAQKYFNQNWLMAFVPGLSIFLTVLALNLFGEGLTEALNPRRNARSAP